MHTSISTTTLVTAGSAQANGMQVHTFAPEFAKDGRLNLYAHFEESGFRARDQMASRSGVQWQWGWHADGGSKDEWYRAQKDSRDAVEELKQDPYPPFPERLSLDDPVYVTKVEKPQHTPAIAAAPPPYQPQIPLIQSGDFVMVDETTNRNILENGIIIGHARPHCCRDPRERPTARAILTQKGKLVAYITAKHSNRESAGVGDIMIPLKNIDYIERFNVVPFGEDRRQAILDALPKATFIKLEEDTSRRSDSTARVLSEGVVIGKAKPYCSRDPANPPLVRAVLSSAGSAIVYIEAKESKKRLMKGMAQINLRDVDFVEGLQGVSVSKRGKAVRAMILQAKGHNGEEAEEKGRSAEEKKNVGEKIEID